MTIAVYLQVNRFFPSEVDQRVVINKWLTENKIAHSSVQWFIDREDKTEFKQLITDINNGSISTFAIYSLEQAYPSIASITDALYGFALKKITFASVSQSIYFSHESIMSAHLLLTIVRNLADHHKRTRQKIGIDKAREKGLYKGKKPGCNKPGVDIKKCVRWKARGWTAKQIAKKIGIAESTVFRYLRISKTK